MENVTAIVSDSSFRAINYGTKFDMTALPEEIQQKVVDTGGSFLLCYMSDEMIHRFHQYPTVIAIDGTHGTNSSKFILISINIFGELCKSLVLPIQRLSNAPKIERKKSPDT